MSSCPKCEGTGESHELINGTDEYKDGPCIHCKGTGEGKRMASAVASLGAYDVYAMEYAFYPAVPNFSLGTDKVALYPFIKLSGEAGEMLEKIAKGIRDDAQATPGAKPTVTREDLLGELGDILWYVTACARCLGSNLKELANRNLDKLASRDARGVLAGSGGQ